MIKRLIGVCLLAACLMMSGFLVACNTTSADAEPSAATIVFKIRGGYVDFVLSNMARYNELPRCGTAGATKICSDQKVVDQLRKSDAAAKVALDSAENQTRNLPQLDATFVINSAVNAISAVSQILTLYGITTDTVNAQGDKVPIS